MNRAQRRLLSSKPQVADLRVQTHYGIHDGKLVVQFSQPLNNLLMTPDEAKAMIAAMEMGVKELEKA